MPKVFLCFATEDLDFVMVLFSRLKRLGVAVWDYSHRDEEIKLGEKINDSLTNRIAEADFFVPVVSFNSVNPAKACIQHEVQVAAEKHKKCYPVIISCRRPAEWAGAFELISDRKFMEMDHTDAAEFEEKICALCSNLNVVYEPDITDHQRLPLYRKLQQEMQSLLNEVVKPVERYVYEKLMGLVNEFNFSYSQGQWEKSLDTIKYFLAFTKHEIKSTGFYYPLIAKGACELQLDLSSDAERTFQEAMTNSKADENAYGGLGHVYFRQCKFSKALDAYQLALTVCPPEQQTEILYNILLTASEILNDKGDGKLMVEASRIIHYTDYIHQLDAATYATNKERQRVKYLIGLCLFQCGKWNEAHAYFKSVYENEVFQMPVDLYAAALNSGIVCQDLHRVFKENGFLIPVGLPIGRRSENWIILDGNSIYRVMSIKGSLLVFYKELSLLIHYSRLLESLQQPQKAIDLLKAEAFLLNNRLLFHHYADLLAREGYLKEAMDTYRTQLCQPPHDKQWLVEYALLLKYFKEYSVMQQHCELAIGLGMPADIRECYYHGFAYYLSGKIEQARAYYTDA